MKLLLPVAGKSSRFPGLRPKWLLTLPNGQLMIERSLSGLRLENINEVVVIMLSEHKKYIKPIQIKDLISDTISSEIKVNIFELNQPTISQPETIACYLKANNEDFDEKRIRENIIINGTNNKQTKQPVSIVDSMSYDQCNRLIKNAELKLCKEFDYHAI